MEYNLNKISESKLPVDIEALSEFTFKNGTKLPSSYVSFAKQYGYGLSCGLFLIYVPLQKHCDSLFERAASIKSTYQDVLDCKEELWFDLQPDLKYEQLKNLYPFAMSENGHYLFWDLESKTTLKEFDIYITDFRGAGFIKAASNLYDFFSNVTSQSKYKQVLPFAQEPLLAIFEG